MSTLEAPSFNEYNNAVERSQFQQVVAYGKRLIGRSALALGLATGIIVGETAAVEPPAAIADTGGYPDAEAPCVANNNGVTQGSDYWCSGYQWGYYIRNSQGQITGNYQNSSRGFGFRNCTDWAAFRAEQLTDILVPYGTAMGHGGSWDDNAPTHSYVVDNMPEPGDIAVWDGTTSNAFGRVAVVESTNTDGTANVSEYNRSLDGTYGTRSSVTADHYIDLNGTGKGVNGDIIAAGGGSGGAVTLARPAAINFNNALNVFIRGGDGQIYAQYWNGTNWTGYASIGGNMLSDPALIVNNNALNVFARGIDNQIYTQYNNGSGWSGWASLGTTTMKGNPKVVQYGSEIDLFALGSDNHPYKNTWNGSAWGGWTSLGNYMDSSPAPVVYGTELDVFMRGGDNNIYKDTWNGSSWSGFGGLAAGGATGNPDAISYGGQLTVWTNTTINQVFKRTWNGSAWGSWESMGGGLNGDPDAMQYNNDMEVFARGGDGKIYTRYWSANGNYWSSWAATDNTKTVAGDPTAIQYGSELDVFAVGTDGKTYKNTFQPSTGWGGFTALPG